MAGLRSWSFWIQLAIGLACFGLYSLYYLLVVVRKPKIYSHPSSYLADAIKDECPIFTEHYWPPPWAFGCHFTTVLRSAVQNSVPVQYRREVVTLRDGGKVALDWAIGDFTTNKSTPILLILPGLTGSSYWNYVTHLAQDGLTTGYRSVVMNQRGIASIPMGTAKSYCATSTDDLRDVVECVVSSFPQAPIVGIGVSIGGIILTKYLCDYKGDEKLSCVVTLCSPWDMFATSWALNTFPSKQLYNQYLCGELKKLALRHREEFDPNELPFDVNSQAFEEMNTIQDFDRMITIRFHGYSSVEEYYRDGSNAARVSQLSKPLIAINTADDPFIPVWSLPVSSFQDNPNVVLIVPSRGGHFGFLEGISLDKPTWMDRAACQCLTMLRQKLLPTRPET
jgi:abhydrolase domain-containing protein 1/3